MMSLSTPFASLSLSSTASSLYLPSDVRTLQFVKPDSKYDCISCGLILREPVQEPCGHRMCSPCLERLANESGENGFPCPSGEEDCGFITKDQVHPDYSVRRELAVLEVYCLNQAGGCPAKMQWKMLKNHLETECQYASVGCPYKCGASNMERSELENHLLQCPLKPIECKFKHIGSSGCNFQGTKVEMGAHLVDNHLEHLDMLAVRVVELELENDRIRGNVQEVNGQHEQIKSEIARVNTDLAEMRNSLHSSEGWKASEKNLMKLVASSSERIIKIETKLNTAEEKFRELEVLTARSQQMMQAVQQLQSAGGGVAKGGVSEEIRGQVQSHDRTVQEHDKQLAEMDLRMQCMETTNFQGTLIWKINDYHQRLVEAKSGKTLSLYSQPFYTSRYGYKMCARVYLNGDGAGRNRFISFFFVIMQGDYDDILSWPFKQKVTLMLLDQRNQRKPISDTFRPDPTSSSFQKPVTAMNVASGCPQFVEHGTLENDDVYLKNEILFFKVVVDTSDLLNP